MLIEGDPSNWKDTLRQYVLMNDLNVEDAPAYEEFIENLVNSLTEAWSQIITAKIAESQEVVIPLALLVKIGVLQGMQLDPKSYAKLSAIMTDPQVIEFIKNPSSQLYLPIKKS